MAFGKKTGGRAPGTPNKVTLTVKENVMAVFNGLGGAQQMQSWAHRNQSEFYKIYSKLIPTDISIDPDNNKLIIEVRDHLTDKK